MEARLARGEGDPERLHEVRDRPRAEAAIARRQPVLQDKLPVLVHVLASKDNRESLSHALAELAAALRTVERATAETTPA